MSNTRRRHTSFSQGKSSSGLPDGPEFASQEKETTLVCGCKLFLGLTKHSAGGQIPQCYTSTFAEGNRMFKANPGLGTPTPLSVWVEGNAPDGLCVVVYLSPGFPLLQQSCFSGMSTSPQGVLLTGTLVFGGLPVKMSIFISRSLPSSCSVLPGHGRCWRLLLLPDNSSEHAGRRRRGFYTRPRLGNRKWANGLLTSSDWIGMVVEGFSTFLAQDSPQLLELSDDEEGRDLA
ncbi:unnamed protein product [Cyprideis torosa]|uniref:Uncharacterized protein n=1 Tax=Cyprideis torosa TaxID=163714 RepID=A0A7R8WAF6_9CRUS|nr:unnamed protein product [Cyprideis torosa]CAG0885428.1 unnamed protein product [Cyprideis torosa]